MTVYFSHVVNNGVMFGNQNPLKEKKLTDSLSTGWLLLSRIMVLMQKYIVIKKCLRKTTNSVIDLLLSYLVLYMHSAVFVPM